MGSEVFLDSSCAVALVGRSDSFHERAVAARRSVETSRRRLVTSHAVITEIANFLAKAPDRAAAVTLIDAIVTDPDIEVACVTPELFARAYELYRNRPDKEWGLTDCISFEIMRERGITDALTADEHFQQAGFRALLREG